MISTDLKSKVLPTKNTEVFTDAKARLLITIFLITMCGVQEPEDENDNALPSGTEAANADSTVAESRIYPFILNTANLAMVKFLKVKGLVVCLVTS